MATFTKPDADEARSDREIVFDAFRRWGYLQANLDPLTPPDHKPPQTVADLEFAGPAAEDARRYYCGTIGAEFMHIPDPQRRRWIEERLETDAPEANRERILERLVEAELFEQMLQARYLGTKRFSLEGNSSLIPLLDEALDTAGARGAEQIVLAMSHRGRLNVLRHIVNKDSEDVFAKFEDVDPRSVLGSGDVKYHMGATGHYQTSSGKSLSVHLVSNPSHLEAVDPVAVGRTRAKQARHGERGQQEVLAVVMHGDAAFAGQGIWAETLDLSGVPGFEIGGAIHVIVNNLIGFTATPRETVSSAFASDIAKRNPIPIFHVNGEDPEAVVRIARLAVEYRYTFGTDVVIDVIGYRRHGHSEIDDPTITSPLLYRKIEAAPPTYENYARHIGADPRAMMERVRQEFDEAHKRATAMKKRPALAKLPDYWSKYRGGCYKPEYEVKTAVARDELTAWTERLTQAPEGFHVHPKIKKLLQQRHEMGADKRAVDYGMAEALAFASLLVTGTPVRLSGQDSRRGTFNQRHSVLVDVENEQEYVPLQHVADDQARCEIYNSILSEAAVMGFEYGYSRDFPETLTLWEAQFGDFANGAQVIIDQFISSGEDKWGLLSGLVLLLPHGYEGQGPEHSSARIERFLQLAARDNFQVCQPSTAAQYFHLLRRQALRPWRKPLVVFTPKSMLRHPAAASKIDEFTRDAFLRVIPDTTLQNAERVLVCSGKIGHELQVEREKRKDTKTAILFLDQLYPWPEQELTAALAQHPGAREVVWVQEEPANQGALWFAVPKLRKLARDKQVRSIKRSASASPSTGSAKAHELEQKTLVTLAFTTA
jgi:2-oxoglutarate dehydrogenase E1 component